MNEITACGACREMAANRAWVLRALGHKDCIEAIRAERLAARRFWIRINPQGCVVGSALAEYVGEDSVEGAHAEFVPDRPTRLYEAAHGWRHERVSHAEWKQRAEGCLMGDCHHREAA
ncbi:hypothetical protein ACI3K4_27855 [Streptomyces sp. CSMPJR101]|uniref:hypothetical protein n=1 Tax=Streptomyces sp. CSMPJR101 TaxID=1279378 RepID=UPI00385204B7